MAKSVSTLIVTLTLFSSSVIARDYRPGELSAFRSDGCTAFVNGDLKTPDLFLHCCVQHDVSYWGGGTSEDRLNADNALYNCVLDATKSGVVAGSMFRSVRMGGGPRGRMPYRWGYGWPYGRGFKAVNEEERDWLHRALNDYDCRENISKLTSNEATVDRICTRDWFN